MKPITPTELDRVNGGETLEINPDFVIAKPPIIRLPDCPRFWSN
ncbi:MAG TPA: hypothetical protein VEL07_15590 [Planctomycetota bacterium]|nr:hypothetical protein [Planctomycetota bacterium]